MFQRLVAQRRLIGWLALVGLLGGALFCAAAHSLQDGAGGSLLRVGFVLAALWLALPEKFIAGTKSFSFWQGLMFLSVMLAIVRRPWVVIPVLMILGALSLFARPRH